MAHKQQFASFADMISGSSTPILVDFYANWCGPCRIMGQILEQVKAQMGDQLTIVKIDTDKYPEIASQWQVYALPTLVLFKEGRPVDRIEGVMQPGALIHRLRTFL
ncbi:MAG: thioredoxin [Thermostichales cyanobacterium SZTDM-1c_bins_54]